MTCFCRCLCELHYGITCFFLQLRKKKFAKWHVYFSLLEQEQIVLLCSLETPLFFSCDLTCLNFFEYISRKKKQAKFDFIILRWINHKTPPLSLKQGAIFIKYRKSNIFNTEYLFSCHLSFSNHNDKISVLPSQSDYFSKQLRNRKFELVSR